MRKENILVIILIVLVAAGVLYYRTSGERLNATTIETSDTAAEDGSSRIIWSGMSDGFEKARKENKHIFLYFYADWCTYCTKLKKTTFKDKGVLAALDGDFVSVAVNSDKHKEIARKWRVTGLPSLWFLKPDGTQIGNIPGYVPPEHMMNILNYIRSGKYETMRFQEYMTSMKG